MLCMVGCASTITVSPDGTITAKDYTVRVNTDGSKTMAPNRWFTTGFLSTLFGGLFSTAQTVAPLVAPAVTGK